MSQSYASPTTLEFAFKPSFSLDFLTSQSLFAVAEKEGSTFRSALQKSLFTCHSLFKVLLSTSRTQYCLDSHLR